MIRTTRSGPDVTVTVESSLPNGQRFDLDVDDDGRLRVFPTNDDGLYLEDTREVADLITALDEMRELMWRSQQLQEQKAES